MEIKAPLAPWAGLKQPQTPQEERVVMAALRQRALELIGTLEPQVAPGPTRDTLSEARSLLQQGADYAAARNSLVRSLKGPPEEVGYVLQRTFLDLRTLAVPSSIPGELGEATSVGDFFMRLEQQPSLLRAMLLACPRGSVSPGMNLFATLQELFTVLRSWSAAPSLMRAASLGGSYADSYMRLRDLCDHSTYVFQDVSPQRVLEDFEGWVS